MEKFISVTEPLPELQLVFEQIEAGANLIKSMISLEGDTQK
jgi:hypothetical protein